MQSVKETAANIAASAKAGVEKTKATVQEKVEKMQAHSPMEKAMATEKKEEKANTSRNQQAGDHEAQCSSKTFSQRWCQRSRFHRNQPYRTRLVHQGPPDVRNARTWNRAAQWAATSVEGLGESHPIGGNSGTGRTMAHNTRAGANPSGPYDSIGVDNSYITPGATINPIGTASYSTTGEHGLSTGGHQMSAMPGHGTGQPTGGHVVEGVVESHPIGMNSGTGRTLAHNTKAGGNPPGPYHGTGGSYS
ncbi:hypothetical protein Patl1_32993 [Pistacia atlantica]|uniref:Uncharacterized protein n=1 Tax=Pistacia atlantica TaxID=434234 RepID=A0ACC1AP62_9ROSI|nr:hypothetical protein Patl1_32993 [Pistacia atlantica]